MRRREFVTLVGGAAIWPLAAQAQQTGKVVRVGYLSLLSAARHSGWVFANLATLKARTSRSSFDLQTATMTCGPAWQTS